jgi:hypothetical protein
MSNYLEGAELDDLFSGADTTKAKFQANYSKQGEYIVAVRQCKAIKTRDGKKGSAIELTVVRVLNTVEGAAAHDLGEDYTWMPLRKEGMEASYLGRMKRFMGATLGGDADAVSAADLKTMVTAQPLQGMLLRTRQFVSKPPYVDMEFNSMTLEDVTALGLDESEVERFCGGKIRNRAAVPA